MSDSDDGHPADAASLAAEEAFAVLGSETRLAILRTLWDAGGPLPYSAIKSQVGVRDSGRFNYHLGRVTGQFVRKSADGYELRVAGEAVLRAVLAGAITDDPALGPTELPTGCPHCGRPLTVAYRDERVVVRCPGTERGEAGGEVVGAGPVDDAGHVASDGDAGGGVDDPGRDADEGDAGTGAVDDTGRAPSDRAAGPPWVVADVEFPPAGLAGRSPASLLRALPVWYASKVGSLVDGVCPECGGTTAAALSVCPDHEVVDGHRCRACSSPFAARVRASCDTCRYRRRFPLYHLFPTDAAVVAFFHDHGVDVLGEFWAVAPHLFDYEETPLSTDPPTVVATVALGEERLAVTVDDGASVVDVTRRPPQP